MPPSSVCFGLQDVRPHRRREAYGFPSGCRDRAAIPARVRTFGRLAGFMLCVAMGAGLEPGLASAATLESESYTQIGGHFSSTASTRLGPTSPSAEYLGTGAALGEGIPVSATGASPGLETVVSGFWAIVAGGFASLDADLDGIQSFLDPDDDNDGLFDTFETGTGVFVSEINTGTSPNNADSDGDGFDDGLEVAQGSNPTDPTSTPNAPQVPVLSPFGTAIFIALLVLAGIFFGPMSFSPPTRTPIRSDN